MKTLLCTGFIKRTYPIYLSNDATFEDLVEKLPKGVKKIVVIDNKIIDCFPTLIKKFNRQEYTLFPIQANEDQKTFSKLESLCKEIYALKPCRDDVIVAIGGGLVMNLAGLTGSLVMRGIRFYYVPTTLTGQIDASLGSKQAVNFMDAKNWIGTYNDPEFCYVNPHFLLTAPKYELNSQVIEGVKLCLATNKELFYETYDMLRNFYNLPFPTLCHFVETMIKTKLPVVDNDLLEENYGMSMLYGHTIGHALEMLDHKNLSHGEAVGLGMLVAAKISNLLGIASDDIVHIHKEILARLELKTTIPAYIPLSEIEEMLYYNKKNYSGMIRFVLLEDIGKMVQEEGKYYKVVPQNIVKKAIQETY